MPDATYSITFENCEDTTHTLQPPLVLSPGDKREVYFTLDLLPVGGREIDGASYLDVRLLYRSEDGLESGEIALAASSMKQIQLAGYTNSDVIVKSGLRLTNPDRGWIGGAHGFRW